eukprot:TRINITY_DN75872_c0_g1_i1.p1 TRINITY_DN75872_c0_g1~~TRINITY_DN75872_c0_g1_i1.p1  ORF type:complete len:313 (-),score=85.66 TRINITY_DN75872_c0_g1_i1:26-964(-)
MLVVLSAAMRFHAQPVTEVARRSSPRLLTKTKALVQELRRLEAKDIKKQLHVNDALAKQYAQHLTQFESKQPVPACCLYDSALFNSASLHSFEYDDAEWANSHVHVFSGLYGLVRPFDEIQTLSLPVSLNTKLTNSKGKFLRDYWREYVMKEIEESLQRLPMPVIVNLAADEDQQLLSTDLLPEGTRVAKVDFKTIDKSSVLDAKGEFLRWMLENRCMTVEDLLEFKGLIADGEAATYRVHPKASSPDSIVFEENIGDGGDGGWSKKLAQFGGSKAKFIKEEASGKDRWRRTEMNKALRKDEKQKRSKNEFY